MEVGAKGNKGRVRPTHALAVGALSLLVVFSLGSLMSGGRSSTNGTSYGGAALAPVFATGGTGHGGDVGARLTAYEGKMADLMNQMASVRQEVADVANTVANLEQAVAEGGGRRYTPRSLTLSLGPHWVFIPWATCPANAHLSHHAAVLWCGLVTQGGSARDSYGWVGNSPPVLWDPHMSWLPAVVGVCQLGVKPTTRTLAHRSPHQPSTRLSGRPACVTRCQRRRTGSVHATTPPHRADVVRPLREVVVPPRTFRHSNTTSHTHTPSATRPGDTRGGRRQAAGSIYCVSE